MAIPNRKYFNVKRREGVNPVSQPSPEVPENPLNPDGLEGQVPPVAQRYDSEAEMIADQESQRSGYLYFDGTNTWWWKGTTGAVDPIDDYEPFFGGDNPTNVSYLNLTDTDDTDYTGKIDFVPHVNETETGLILKRINKNVDGGFANSVYLTVQQIDGGSATI